MDYDPRKLENHNEKFQTIEVKEVVVTLVKFRPSDDQRGPIHFKPELKTMIPTPTGTTCAGIAKELNVGVTGDKYNQLVLTTNCWGRQDSHEKRSASEDFWRHSNLVV
jgi:hypothetical protein